MNIDSIKQTAAHTLKSGPYRFQLLKKLFYNEGGSITLGASIESSGYCHPAELTTIEKLHFSLPGTGVQPEPQILIFINGKHYLQTSENEHIALSTAGLGTTCLAPIMWLDGVTTVQAISNSLYQIRISIPELLNSNTYTAGELLESLIEAQIESDSFLTGSIEIQQDTLSEVNLTHEPEVKDQNNNFVRDETQLRLWPTAPKELVVPDASSEFLYLDFVESVINQVKHAADPGSLESNGGI